MMATRITVILALVAALALPRAAGAITRAEVITNAQTYTYHPWYCSEQNLSGSGGGCSGYRSVYTVGDHMGLAYDWGGFMSIDYYDRHIRDGYGAGSYSSDGVLACTVGLDCSGFVSSCWDSTHFSTLSIQNTLPDIEVDELMAGDVFNFRGDGWGHVILWYYEQADGRPFLYESVGYGVHAVYAAGWDYVDGYIPRRYHSIEGGEPAEFNGTATHPVEVVLTPDPDHPGSSYFVHASNTRDSTSSAFDQCAADWDNWESGPEMIYRVELDSPGQLVAVVESEGGSDIDVHVFEDLNELDCIARGHITAETAVDCGEYYVVADSWTGTQNGDDHSGAYTLTVTFTPNDNACGEPHGYDVGRLGDPCGFEGNPSLAECNPHRRATTCLYTGTTASDESWCSVECDYHTDCTGEMPGGCCADIGNGEKYCVIANYCSDVPPDDLGTDPEDAGVDVVSDDISTSNPEAGSSVDASGDAGQGAETGGSGQSDRPGSTGREDQSEFLVKSNEGCGCTHSKAPAGYHAGWLGFGLFFLVSVLRRRKQLAGLSRSPKHPKSLVFANCQVPIAKCQWRETGDSSSR